MSARKKFLFVTTNCDSPWGGSEVLWSDAARILSKQGHAVSCSVVKWPTMATAVVKLKQDNIEIFERSVGELRPGSNTIKRGMGAVSRWASKRSLARWLSAKNPDLICISIGSPADDLSLMEVCALAGRPYAIVVQANSETVWPEDDRALRLARFFSNASKVYFVSARNKELLETQLAISLPQGEVVRNPFNVRYNADVPWPKANDVVRLACIARLEPRAKGQDLVLKVLASEPWKSRAISVSFFGRGHMESGLKRLAEKLGLAEKVCFPGHIDNIESVWADHHALILPSRYEGLPLALVEAMLCGRPAVLTDVAGNTEFFEDGVCGFVAEAPTETHLAEAMERFWQSRTKWQEMGAAGRLAVKRSVSADPSADFAQALLTLSTKLESV